MTPSKQEGSQSEQGVSERLSTTELVERCRRGDAEAWQALVARYGRLVHSVAVRHGLAPTDVEDVGQEVFLALAQQLEQIEDAERLPGWLMTTARRTTWRVIQARRREGPAPAADVGDGDPPDGRVIGPANMPTIQELQRGWDRQMALSAGFEKLGERCRHLLYVIFLDPAEPSYAEISQRLTIPEGSIGPTRNRCLAQLRAILEGLGFDNLL